MASTVVHSRKVRAAARTFLRYGSRMDAQADRIREACTATIERNCPWGCCSSENQYLSRKS